MDEPIVKLELLEGRGVPVQTVDAGERVFLEGDPGDCMYAVVSGRIDVITYGTVLENVGPNGLFGEMALIDDSPRSAAAVAAETSDVAKIDKDAFLYLVSQEPEFALRVMSLLATRIRRMNEHL